MLLASPASRHFCRPPRVLGGSPALPGNRDCPHRTGTSHRYRAKRQNCNFDRHETGGHRLTVSTTRHRVAEMTSPGKDTKNFSPRELLSGDLRLTEQLKFERSTKFFRSCSTSICSAVFCGRSLGAQQMSSILFGRNWMSTRRTETGRFGGVARQRAF